MEKPNFQTRSWWWYSFSINRIPESYYSIHWYQLSNLQRELWKVNRNDYSNKQIMWIITTCKYNQYTKNKTQCRSKHRSKKSSWSDWMV